MKKVNIFAHIALLLLSALAIISCEERSPSAGEEVEHPEPPNPDIPLNDVEPSVDGDMEPNNGSYGYASGEASAEVVERISTTEELCDIALRSKDENFAGVRFVLTCDIDLAGYDNLNISSSAVPFKGYFDGAGYKITDLSITDFGFERALFRVVGYGGVVRNLTIERAAIGGDISSNERSYGALAGVNCGLISCCTVVDSVIKAGGNVGALVGENRGSVEQCRATGCRVIALEDGGESGDLVGFNSGFIR